MTTASFFSTLIPASYNTSYAPAIENEYAPCSNCGTNKVHSFDHGTICHDCREMEAPWCDTTYQIAKWLRAGSTKAIGNPHATEEEKRIGSFNDTLLTYFEDHDTAAFLDYVKDCNARLNALYVPTDIEEDIQTELVHKIVITEVIINRLQGLV